MTLHIERLISEFRALTEEEKLRVLDAILTDLNNESRDLDHLWVLEARKRWARYKAGQLRTLSYEEVIGKYNR